MKRILCCIASCVLSVSVFCSVSMAVDFPARSNPKYVHVPPVEIETLYNDYISRRVVIVDVRSKIEYDTIHIDGALHIPLSSALFESKVKRIARENPGKKIAFYCNGTTCLKSYEAQRRAADIGVGSTYAFDLGIPGWAQDFPEKTVLLGKPMNLSEIKWIPKADFKKKCLPWEVFQKKSLENNITLIDARDSMQKGDLSKQEASSLSSEERKQLETFMLKNDQMISELSATHTVLSQPFDKLVRNIIKRGAWKDKTLLIFDQVGKQVRWLMYQLEAEGYTNYYFLDKGAYKVIGMQAYNK